MIFPPIGDLMKLNHIEPLSFPPMISSFEPKPCCACSNPVPKQHIRQKESSVSVPSYDLPKSLCLHMFTPEEDAKLKEFVKLFGTDNWDTIACIIGTKTARQCRDRWYGYFNPKAINAWTVEEDLMLIKHYATFGAKWKKIAMLIPGRSVNSIRNRWKLLLKNTEKHFAQY